METVVIIACVTGIVSAIVAVSSYVSNRRYARSVRRPRPAALWSMDAGNTLHIFPQNQGHEIATGFHVMARFPSEAKIESLSPGAFELKRGGIGNSYAVLVAPRVHPSIALEPISIVAKENEKEVGPAEVSSWCQEDTAFINIPQYPD